MAQMLVDAQQVLDRLANMQGIRVPTTLTAPVINAYIEGATARILRSMSITYLPSNEGLERKEAEDVCLDIVLFKIRKDFFGLDAETMSALSQQIDKTLLELEAAVEGESDEAPESVTMRVVGGRNQ